MNTTSGDWQPTAPSPGDELARHRQREPLWQALAVGLVLIAAWYIATRTTLLLAYRAGTLAQTQSLCDSTLGRVARGMTTQAAVDCAHVDSLAMWVNLAGTGGVLLVVGVLGYAVLARR